MVKQPVAQMVELPSGYREFLVDLKDRIRKAQVIASLSASREMILLYWDIGKGIVDKQEHDGWGTNVIEELATDIQKAFPGIKGFSSRNIWRMRAFYLAYSKNIEELAQKARELSDNILPQAVAEIPWGHNVRILDYIKNQEERLWYIQKTIGKGN